jgi:hypothetical protein
VNLTRLARSRLTWVVAAVLAVVAVVALFVFEPWKLWVNATVNEAPPVAAAPSAEPSGQASAAAAIATGTFISHEHATTGSVSILDLGGGKRTLRIADLDTSNGPDLHVWLADAQVKPGSDGWRVFDDGRYLELGKLKGNRGSQNYAIPESANLHDYRSVTIWCDRFNVSFGAATLSFTG